MGEGGARGNDGWPAAAGKRARRTPRAGAPAVQSVGQRPTAVASVAPKRRRPMIPAAYRDHVRVRAGALVVRADRLLLVEHDGLWEPGAFWTPPGGGVAFGEGLAEALAREVREETGLDVTVGPLRYVLDFVRPPLHAVSFYFSCEVTGDPGAPAPAPALGRDPELETQMLRSVRWVPLDHLAGLTLYPEPFHTHLADDVRAGFPGGPRYLGTFR